MSEPSQISTAVAAAASTSSQFVHTVLNCGLTIIGELQAQAKTVALGYFVHTGARDERPSEHGVSHFLEHMLFKGYQQLDAIELNERFDALGAQYNAFTSEDATVYHAAVLPKYVPELLDLLSAMMQPALRPEDVDMEKQVILEEIEMYQDQPTTRLFDTLRARYYAQHPLGQNVLGTAASVQAISPEMLRSYWQQRYAASNMILAVSGAVDWSAFVQQAKQITQTWSHSPKIPREYPNLQPQYGHSHILDTALNRHHLAFMATGYATQDPLRYAAYLLSEVIGGENGRLFWVLVDSGLADAAQLSHIDDDHSGHFEGFLSCDPQRQAECWQLYQQVLVEVQAKGIEASELIRAQRRLAVNVALRSESPYSRLFSFGTEWLYNQHYMSSAETVQHIQAVTMQDIQTVLAKQPFSHLAICTLGPIEP